MKHHLIVWAEIFLLAWASYCMTRDMVMDFLEWRRVRKQK